MSTLEINRTLDTPAAGLLQRSAVLGYGILAYNTGFLALLWLILSAGGLAPAVYSPLATGSVQAGIAVNLALIMLFGIQHTIMARQSFKRWLSRHLPAAMERSTFVLLSGVCLALAVWLWQPLPGIVWSVENSAANLAIWCLFALGWSYLLAATFVTNHFELFGLRQVYLHFIGKPYSALPFTRKFMYRYSRHPMMLGLLTGLWAVPVMSATHFALAGLLTLYSIVGVIFEERDLLRQFGNTYRAYQKEIAALVPGLF